MLKCSFNDPAHLHAVLREPIRSNRMLIRRPQAADSEAISLLFSENDKDCARLYHWENENCSPSSVRGKWIKFFRKLERLGYGTEMFAFYRGRAIGVFSCSTDSEGFNRISYFISKDYRRQGFAKEAFQAIAQRMEDFGYPITLRVPPENRASMAFAKSLGFYPAGRRVWSGNPFCPHPVTMQCPLRPV